MDDEFSSPNEDEIAKRAAALRNRGKEKPLGKRTMRLVTTLQAASEPDPAPEPADTRPNAVEPYEGEYEDVTGPESTDDTREAQALLDDCDPTNSGGSLPSYPLVEDVSDSPTATATVENPDRKTPVSPVHLASTRAPRSVAPSVPDGPRNVARIDMGEVVENNKPPSSRPRSSSRRTSEPPPPDVAAEKKRADLKLELEAIGAECKTLREQIDVFRKQAASLAVDAAAAEQVALKQEKALADFQDRAEKAETEFRERSEMAKRDLETREAALKKELAYGEASIKELEGTVSRVQQQRITLQAELETSEVALKNGEALRETKKRYTRYLLWGMGAAALCTGLLAMLITWLAATRTPYAPQAVQIGGASTVARHGGPINVAPATLGKSIPGTFTVPGEVAWIESLGCSQLSIESTPACCAKKMTVPGGIPAYTDCREIISSE